MNRSVYTIGYSTFPIERLIALLKGQGITAVADVRSSPYSRINPQFNRERLEETLKAAGITYVFLGEELGARSKNPDCYEAGRVRYDRLARTRAFRRGIKRVHKGAAQYRLALMCAEKEPLDCHRTILVARHLEEEGLQVSHILADGSVETHEQTMDRLKKRLRLDEDLFRPLDEATREAYEIQGGRIAYEIPRSVGAASEETS